MGIDIWSGLVVALYFYPGIRKKTPLRAFIFSIDSGTLPLRIKDVNAARISF